MPTVLGKIRPLALLAVLACLVLASALVVDPASAQSDRDVQDLLDRFDGRVGEVEALVDASRNPTAASLLQSAISLRNQAENALQMGNLEEAMNLASRALSTLDKAQREAERTPGEDITLDKLERRLDSQRQIVEDVRRRLEDVELRHDGNPTKALNNSTFFERLSASTLDLIDEAETAASGNTDNSRDDDLVERARGLYDRANAVVPQEAGSGGTNDRFSENRIRQADNLLNQAESDLIQIQREIDAARNQGGQGPVNSGAINSRLRTIDRQTQIALTELDLVDRGGRDTQRSNTGPALTMFRRASELARQAIRSAEDAAGLEGDFNNRN